MVPIDKDVPIPKKRTGGGSGRPAKYPWKVMEIGDSFLAKVAKPRRFGTLAARAGKTHGRKFTCRTVEGGVRVWRVA